VFSPQQGSLRDSIHRKLYRRRKKTSEEGKQKKEVIQKQRRKKKKEKTQENTYNPFVNSSKAKLRNKCVYTGVKAFLTVES
jgi:hypothetical protein